MIISQDKTVAVAKKRVAKKISSIDRKKIGKSGKYNLLLKDLPIQNGTLYDRCRPQ